MPWVGLLYVIVVFPDHTHLLFDLICYENLADVIEVVTSSSIYLVDLFNIDNPYFEQMLSQIYLIELQINNKIIFDI